MQVSSAATIRGDIADCLKENAYGAGEFIGLQAMPLYSTQEKSGTYAKIEFAQQLTSAVLNRAPGAGYKRQIREATTDTYTCEEFGVEELVDDGEAQNLSKYFDAELDAAMSAAGLLRLEQEARIAAILFDDTTAFGTSKTDGSNWSSAADGTPIKDIRAALNKMKEQVNGALMGARLVALCHDTTLDNALRCKEVVDALNYGGNGFADRDAASAALARAVGLDAIFASSIKRAGAAVWAAHKFGIYVVSAGLQMRSVPQVGRSFIWTADCPENAMVETYRDESRRSEVVRVRQFVDEKLFTARAGHVLYGLNA